MASNSRTNSINRYLLSAVVGMFLTGCTLTHTAVSNPGILKQKKVVFIYGVEDSLKIKETVRNWVTRRGYLVTDDRSRAELTVDLNYQCRWDLFHYTCSKFNFYLNDAASGNVLVHSRFRADTPFGAEVQVKALLERVDKELKKAQDSGSPVTN